MIKRFICIILSFVLCLSLSSCAESETRLSPKKPVTITLWHYYHGVQQTALDALVADFNVTRGLDLGITVETLSFGSVNELAEGVRGSADGNVGSLPMPNIFSSYSDSALPLYEEGKLASINDYFDESEVSEYIQDYISEGRFSDGKIYILPVAKASEVLMLDKTDWDIFEAEVNSSDEYEDVSLGMFSTWEGILKASEIYYGWQDAKTPEKFDGKALFGLDYAANFFFAAARQLGADVVTLEGGSVQIAADKEVMRQLWQTFYVPMLKGHFAALGRFRSDDVKTGDLLGFAGSTSAAMYFPTKIAGVDGIEYPIEAYVSPYPVFEGKKPVVIGQGAGMCIAKSDKRHELASAEFLKWFTAREQNVRFAIDSAGYLPVKAESVASPEMSEAIVSLRQSGQQTDVNLANVMDVFSQQTVGYELYVAPAFQNSDKLRASLESLKTKAAEERAALLEAVKAGADYDTELATRTSDSGFEEFIAGLSE